MIFMELNTLGNVNDICNVCNKYKDKIDVDIEYGRYIIDGCSILAVSSLLGKTIKICPITEDNLLKTYFTNDIKKIGGYEMPDLCGE